MLRNLEGLIGRPVGAIDGDIGLVTGFIIDDARWLIRYMAVECGGWFSRRDVLISAASFLRPDASGGRFPVKITREQIRHAPGTGAAHALAGTCCGRPVYGEVAGFTPLGARAYRDTGVKEGSAVRERFKSMHELEGYEVMAADGEIGGIRDLVFDDIDWKVYYMIVAADPVLRGKTAALATAWVTRVDAASREILMELSREKVKESPAYDDLRPIDRQFEEKLYRYYGMPPYWRR